MHVRTSNGALVPFRQGLLLDELVEHGRGEDARAAHRGDGDLLFSGVG